MAVSIRQIHPVFVGEVSGIDLTRELSRDEVAALEAGMDQYAVLVYHDQHIDDACRHERDRELRFRLCVARPGDVRGARRGLKLQPHHFYARLSNADDPQHKHKRLQLAASSIEPVI